MLSIRMQRLGRKGYPTYRMVVQDKKQAPNSGKVIAYLGSYNPHTKEKSIDTAQAEKFLTNGAHPSPRVAALLISEGIAMPKWVKLRSQTDRTTRNPEKLRKNQPKEEAPVEAAAEEPAAEAEVTEEAPVEA